MKRSGRSASAGKSNETSRLSGRSYAFGKPVVPGGRILGREEASDGGLGDGADVWSFSGSTGDVSTLTGSYLLVFCLSSAGF